MWGLHGISEQFAVKFINPPIGKVQHVKDELGAERDSLFIENHEKRNVRTAVQSWCRNLHHSYFKDQKDSHEHSVIFDLSFE